MPGYRRRAPRRRPARRPRAGRRYPYRRRIRTMNSRIYNFKRTLFLENSVSVKASDATLYSTHFGFTLGMLPSASDFTNLFDQYRINKVSWKLIPKFNMVSALSGAGNALLTQVHTALDYDDSAALPTASALSEITQYQSYKLHRGTGIIRRTVVPKVELGGAATVYPKAYQWIDCDNTAILHNGIKVVIPKPLPAGTELWYDVQMDVYLSCKNVL